MGTTGSESVRRIGTIFDEDRPFAALRVTALGRAERSGDSVLIPN
jgi:hypothetical protein